MTEIMVLQDGSGNILINSDGLMMGDGALAAEAEGDNYTGTVMPITGTGHPTCSDVTEDGTTLYVGMSEAPFIARYVWNSNTEIYDYVDTGIDSLGVYPNALHLSGDGNFMAVAVSGAPGVVSYKWNAVNDRFEATGAVNVSLNTNSSGIGSIEVSDDGSLMSIANYNNPKFDSFKWNETNNRYERTGQPNIAPGAASYFHAATADGMVAVSTFQSASPYVNTYSWNELANRYEKHASIDIAPSSSAAIGAWLSTDASLMAIGSYTGFYTYKWNATNNRYEKTADPSPQVALPIRIYSDDDGSSLIVNNAGAGNGLFSYKWIEVNNRYEQVVGAFTPTTFPSWAKGCMTGAAVGRFIITGGTDANPRFEVYPPHV